MTSQLLAAAASVALVGAGVAGASGVRSFDATPLQMSAVADSDGAGNACRVDVLRTGDSGTVTTTRTVLKDNSCVCTVVTGPSGANGNAEDVVTGILRDRTCAESPTVGRTVSEAATSGGGHSVIIPVLVGVVGAVGLAVALGSNSHG